jgi:hypothetical protein
MRALATTLTVVVLTAVAASVAVPFLD